MTANLLGLIATLSAKHKLENFLLLTGLFNLTHLEIRLAAKREQIILILPLRDADEQQFIYHIPFPVITISSPDGTMIANTLLN